MKIRRSRGIPVLAFAALGISAIATPQFVSAQDGQFSIEEVVVTARKREESLQEVPVAITVFTGDALEQAGIQTTRDLFANTPGLNYDTGFDQNAATPAIRGVVSNEIATYRQKVTTFLDGMPVLGQQGTAPFNAIQQVEVLRGPQSAAFGRSTFGGAINYTTKDPGDVFAADVNVELGQNALTNFSATVSGPIVDGVLSGLLALESKKRDGESDWVTIDEGYGLGGEDSKNLLAKLVYTPTDALSLEFRYKFLDVDNEQTPRDFYPYSTVVAGVDSDPNDNRVVHPDAVADTCGVGAPPPTPTRACAYVGNIDSYEQSYDYNYGDIGIDNPFVRNERDRFEAEITYDFSGGGVGQVMGFNSEESYERATDADLFGNDSGFERDPTDIEEQYLEFRYASPAEARFRYGGGISWYDYDFLTIVYMSEAQFIDFPEGGARQISEFATNVGAFFNLTYDFNDQITGSFEGRYQDDDVGGSNIAASEVTSGKKSTKAFLPRVALTFSPTQDFTIYGQIAKGNNPAGVNSGWFATEVGDAYDAFPEEFPVAPEVLAFFEEEEVLSTEIGIKGTLADRLSYAVNLYHLDWDSYTQVFRGLDFAPTDYEDNDRDGLGDAGTPYEGLDFGAATFLNAGDVTGNGLEIESSYIATDNLRIGFAASLIDITYDDGACTLLASDFGVVPDETIQIGNETEPCNSVAGNEIGTQPKLAAAISFDYSQPLDHGMEWFSRWSTQYTGRQYLSEMNLAELDAFSISDFRTGISTDNWRAEAYVTNLFDEDAPQGIQYFFDGEVEIAGPPTPRTNLVYTERRGRAFGVRLSYDFGG